LKLISVPRRPTINRRQKSMEQPTKFHSTPLCAFTASPELKMMQLVNRMFSPALRTAGVK
jgi:hypothetical protein